MIDAMRLELNLPSVCDRIQELCVKTVVKNVRLGRHLDIVRELQCTRSKSAFVRHVKELMIRYKVAHQCCPLQVSDNGVVPPWEDVALEVIVEPLSMRKFEYVTGYLRATYTHMVDCIQKENNIHVFCDG